MSKLITVLFVSTFSFSALAYVPLNSLEVVNKIENITEKGIKKHQGYMGQKLNKSIDRQSNRIIMDTKKDLKASNIE